MVGVQRSRTLATALHAFLCVLCLVAVCPGCNRNPYAGTAPWGNPVAVNPYGVAPGMPAGIPPVGVAPGGYGQPQFAELERRVQQLDVNNRQLTTQLAQSQQQVQLLRDRENLLQRQLQDTTANLQQERLAKQELQGQARGLQASMAMRGGATLRPNTSGNPAGQNYAAASVPQASQTQNFGPAAIPGPAAIQIPGAIVQNEGAVIRIRVPSDQLFPPGSGQLNPNAYQVLDNVATAILRSYPRQRVVVEAHTDAGSTGGASASPYQLAAAQAQVVVDQLVRRNTLPIQQLTVVAHGANFPRGDNQSPAGRAENRRIEFVVYPETF